MKTHEKIESLDFKAEDDIFRNMPHFVGNLERKVETRKDKIQSLMNNKEDEMKYRELVEEFINVEERFVDNGC